MKGFVKAHEYWVSQGDSYKAALSAIMNEEVCPMLMPVSRKEFNSLKSQVEFALKGQTA